jgi:elongation factor 1 alpha-like protein
VDAIKHYFLSNLGFEEDKLFFVPVSSFLGINIIDQKTVPKEGNWYKGSSLVEIIDKLNVPPKEINKPLRVSITNAYQSNVGKLKGFCVSGKIESGVLLNKKNYMLLPSATPFAVKGIEND